jgi:hypothetical protein
LVYASCPNPKIMPLDVQPSKHYRKIWFKTKI